MRTRGKIEDVAEKAGQVMGSGMGIANVHIRHTQPDLPRYDKRRAA